jgi:uncharacterized OsmC-like protein
MVVVREDHGYATVTADPFAQGNCRTRRHRRPKEREGMNMGPTPTETMVAALIACTNVISQECAKSTASSSKP